MLRVKGQGSRVKGQGSRVKGQTILDFGFWILDFGLTPTTRVRGLRIWDTSLRSLRRRRQRLRQRLKSGTLRVACFHVVVRSVQVWDFGFVPPTRGGA
ncbi:MAG: hypothetical protein ACFKPT_05190 [Gloeotrichia echinulata GP01]